MVDDECAGNKIDPKEESHARLVAIAAMTTRGLSQSDIARITGLTRQRIGQIVDKAQRMGIRVVRRQLKYKTCPVCGTSNRSKIYGGYCSKHCKSKAPPKKRKFGGPSSSIEIDVILCDGCGCKFSKTKRLQYIARKVSEYRGKPAMRSFCTRECYHKNGNGKKLSTTDGSAEGDGKIYN